jgi:cyclic pyranopterin phosphate synthase
LKRACGGARAATHPENLMENGLRNELIDACHRRLNYLRISVTDRCNLRCAYCLPCEDVPRLSHEEVLRYEEILRIVRVGVGLGISKVRVTGGEPLVRKGVVGFLAELARIPEIKDLSLTTNGVRLKEHLNALQAAGVARINISLDTLRPERYRRITGVDAFDAVWEGILAAHARGFRPIKLNVVALAGVNDDELVDLARLSLEHPFHVRFIEFMPIGSSRIGKRPPLLVPEIEERIGALGKLVPVERTEMDGPAHRYRFDGAPGEIGFIPAISHQFCRRCNRLRLTASGQLRPCLLSDRQEDLKGPLRRGCSDADLAEVFFSATRHKPSDHNLAVGEPAHVCCQMRSIGG